MDEQRCPGDDGPEIQIAAFRARDVVKELLTFSIKDNVKKEIIDAGAVVRESIRLIRSSISTNVDIDQRISDGVVPIFGNSTQINQVFINLCSNAADAMVDTGGTISIELGNTTLDGQNCNVFPDLKPGDYVELIVGDDGCGMGKETMGRIFDHYFTTKGIGKGTGIGLAVVHGIIDRHNGAIRVDSKLKGGTVFKILLPVYEGSPEQKIKSQTSLPTGDERILFVDDEFAIRKLGEQRLVKLGYKVTGAQDPSEALSIFQKDPNAFDLVITDMEMPHMTGAQFVTEILKIRPGLPTMLCTGYSEKISKERAYALGICSFIMKPFDSAYLAISVRKVLDEAKK